MVDRRVAWCGALIASLLTWIATRPTTDRVATLEATTNPGFADQDGDLLPDTLEHVLLLDPQDADTTDDGTGDFVHAALSLLPDGSGARGLDHEFRVCCTEERSPSGQPTLWVHNLFRIVQGDLSAIRGFRPFVDVRGVEIPLDAIAGAVGSRLVTRDDPQHGLLVLFSYAIGDPSLWRGWNAFPATFGARVDVGGRTITSGVMVREVSGVLASLVPVDADGLGLQTLFATGNDDPFWRSNRVCRYRLALIGVTTGGVVCEVTETFCIVDPTRRLSCPPSCEEALGRVLFIPDGMRTITGGNQ